MPIKMTISMEDCIESVAPLVAKYNELEAENARLRSALEDIANIYSDNTDDKYRLWKSCDIAKAALRATGEDIDG